MQTITLTERILPEERETHIWFDPATKLWNLDSNISRHFNKALRSGWTPVRQYVYEDGTIAAMAFEASERGITIKSPKKRELSEEHKAKLFGVKNTNLEENFED